MTTSGLTRRSMLAGSAAIAAGGGDLAAFAKAWAQTAQWKPEAGAKINFLRWKRFVAAEDDAFVATLDAFTKATGVQISVSNESYEDVQPKASVAANTGQGPDIIWGLHSLAHLFPAKLLDISDLCSYLGGKYGGWVPVAEAYGKSGGKWICLPIGTSGAMLNYRRSSIEKAGFKEIPKTSAGFLELCKAMKAQGTPAGFAFGHASGDANSFVHWLLWSHGAYLVDKNDKVIINSPETVKALEYGKALYDTLIPGTVSWNDASNNKAFLAGELHLTGNGISIYVAAKADKKEFADDIYHDVWPVGPVGKPTELHLTYPAMIFQYSKVPNACKALLAFMLEAEQYSKWLSGAQGYLTHLLNAYDSDKVWTDDPKRLVFREASKRSLPASGLGTVGEAAASALADFIVVDMFANYVSGREDIKGAIASTERLAKRIYR